MARYLGILAVSLMALISAMQPCEAAEQIVNYNIAAWFDLTGPTAGQYKNMVPAVNTWFGYWNKTTGKRLGVKITPKIYDSQYSASIVAGRHSGIVASDRPIAIMYWGGPVTMSLIEKLPADKIPGIHVIPMYGFINKPYGWQFGPFSTFAETSAAIISYWISQWKENRPMRVAGISIEGAAGEDTINGVRKYCETVPGIEWTVKELTVIKPISLTAPIRRMAQAKTDYVIACHSAPGLAAFYNGMRELGLLGKMRVANPVWFGLDSVKEQLGSEYAEGQFEAQPFDKNNLDNEAAKIFFENVDEFGKGGTWNTDTIWGLISSSIITQAIEKAVKKVDAKSLSGETLFEELNAGKFDGLGVVKEIQFAPENRLLGVTHMKVFEMKNEKVVDVSGFIPIPKIPKWY